MQTPAPEFPSLTPSVLWNLQHAWLPAGVDTDSLPLQVGCTLLATVTTFFVVLVRHSPAAVCVLAGSAVALWWNAVFRPLEPKEKSSVPFIAAFGLWLAWMVVGLLWREESEDTEPELSWAAFIFTDLCLSAFAIFTATTSGYTANLQNIHNTMLWIGVVFSSTSSHIFGPHSQLLHVVTGAGRVLLYFGAFLFFHYYRTELPCDVPAGKSSPYLYPEPNRITMQDRVTVALAGWILLCQFITIGMVLPVVMLVYLRTMGTLASAIKRETEEGTVVNERNCSCGNPFCALEEGTKRRLSDDSATVAPLVQKKEQPKNAVPLVPPASVSAPPQSLAHSAPNAQPAPKQLPQRARQHVGDQHRPEDGYDHPQRSTQGSNLQGQYYASAPQLGGYYDEERSDDEDSVNGAYSDQSPERENKQYYQHNYYDQQTPPSAYGYMPYVVDDDLINVPLDGRDFAPPDTGIYNGNFFAHTVYVNYGDN